MRQPTLPADGGCRCGAVRFRLTEPPVVTAVCHCHGCQRMTGGAYSTTATVSVGGFAVTQGEPVRGGMREGPGIHRHCPDCLSWVFTEIEGMDFVNVRATMFDDATWFAPFMESQTMEALPWALVAAPRTFERFPQPEQYAELMQAYAEATAASS